MGIWLSGAISILLAAQATAATAASGVSVTGIVKDEESAAPIAGVVVSLVDLERSVLTNGEGRYLFLDVPAGPQHVVVRRIGYSARTFHALVPRQGTLEIDVALRAEPIPLETIDVHTAVPVRGLDDNEDTSFPDLGLSQAAVRHHPLLSEPDVLQATSGGEIVVQPESPSGLHIRGGGPDQTAYLLEGVPVLSPYHTGGTFSAWNPDALSRLDVFTSSSPPYAPDALSGAVVGMTRAPGAHFQAQGSLSTTQARMTIAGPLDQPGAGYLLSVRSAYPGLLSHRNEHTYLRGDSGDWLGKLESPLFGGRLSLLGYGSQNDIDAASAVPDSDQAVPPGSGATRNTLGWESISLGSGWTLPLRRATIHLRAWSAVGDAGARWARVDSLPPERLAADRRDIGVVAMVDLAGTGRNTVVGVRSQWSRTSYQLGPVSGEGRSLRLNARTPVTAAFVEHERAIAERGEIDLSLVTAVAKDRVHLGPGARLRWKSLGGLTLTGAYARRHQFAQSLRNTESVVANIFPADLYIGTGATGVPVARSDVGIIALEHRPTAGIRLGAQAYVRDMGSLVLVAPQDDDPFATTGFVEGTGDAVGVALEAAANGARYGLFLAYGLQHVRFEYADTSYVPAHGAGHSIDAGATVFVSRTADVRLGVSSILGRRATAIFGPFEWEACNLVDGGCEFAGGGSERAEPLGTTRLPAYVRVDLGIRKHWHLELLHRDFLVAAFGTATNLLGRKNVLTVAVDPSTGERMLIEMRPRSPLVVGIDWRF